MHTWAATLALADTGTLAPHRLAEIEALEHGTDLWLRGTGEIPRAVPWREVFEIHGTDTLRRPGHLLSAGCLPSGEWQKLSALLGVERPPLSREGLPPMRATLRLIPTSRARPMAFLATSAESWLAFVTHAPEIRLRSLRFAQTDPGRVFVAGEPLPSISGEYFTATERIAAPAGWTWDPALSALALRAALSLEDGETAILLSEGGLLRIPARAWQRSSRAAVRLLANVSRDEY
jgi:hypothetical protein